MRNQNKNFFISHSLSLSPSGRFQFLQLANVVISAFSGNETAYTRKRSVISVTHTRGERVIIHVRYSLFGRRDAFLEKIRVNVIRILPFLRQRIQFSRCLGIVVFQETVAGWRENERTRTKCISESNWVRIVVSTEQSCIVEEYGNLCRRLV